MLLADIRMTTLRKQRILIVEDEPSILDNIAYSLETEGFEPIGCSTGGDALERFSEGFDLVVLDVGLPDVSGFELCKQIREHSTLPIIFLTARASELDRIIGLEIGGDDYMVKPFSPRELSARVKAVLRRTFQQSVRQLGSECASEDLACGRRSRGAWACPRRAPPPTC